MSLAVSGEQVNWGRSPEADRIYQQYLDYYNDIGEKIHAIDSLPYEQRNLPNAQQNRAKLIALQQQLSPIYTYAYNNSAATLASFQNDCASIESQVAQAYNEAISQGGSSIHEAIQEKYDEAQYIAENLAQQISQDQESISSLLNQQETLETLIANLQQEINTLSNNDSRKAKAQQDLEAAKQAFTNLNSIIAEIQSELANLQEDLDAFTGPRGGLNQLKDLAAVKDPTQANLNQADENLKNIKSIENNEKTILQGKVKAANDEIGSANNAITNVQNDLKPLPTIQEQIAQILIEAQSVVADLTNTISEDQNRIQELLNQKASLEITLTHLNEQIQALDAGDSRKAKAQSDWNAANEALMQLNTQITGANAQLATLQGMLNTMNSPEGSITKLQQLATKENPSQSDLDQANAEQQRILTTQNFEQNTLQTSLSVASQNIQSINSLIHTIQIDLQPVDAIEHATWYLDWTSWDYPVPEGVNTVNIFVGNMHLDNQGRPVIDGFGNMNSAKMNAFIEACHAKGIAVKISLGGGGGSYDRCWEALTPGNVSEFAQTLATFCHTHGADGVDFDVEEFTSGQDRPEQQLLVGNFIQQFKNLDPKFQTSICTNAGFGPGFPWQGVVKNLLDGATTVDPATGEKTSAVDRVYIMSYYNSLSQEQEWVLGWADWLQTEYQFKASQITVGLDDTDAHAYDIKEFAAWAAVHGFSTGYWEWNPTTESDSNKSTHDIEDSYNNAHRLAYIPV